MGALELVACIENVGRKWKSSGLQVNVMDLGLNKGGRFSPHRSHQNGLDVDIRYVRKDGKNGPLDIKRSRSQYDTKQTKALINIILDTCNVDVIFVDMQYLGFSNDDLDSKAEHLVHAQGHSNHFHMRLEKPAS